MFSIESMQVLYKQSGLLESFVTHKTKVRLLVQGTHQMQTSEVPIQQRLAIWKNNAFPPFEVSSGSSNVSLEFIFFKNGQQVGKAKSISVVGRSRKDCLDIANRNFEIVGKFLYQINWRMYNNTYMYNGYNNLPQSNMAQNNMVLQKSMAPQNNYINAANLKQPYLQDNENQMRKKQLAVPVQKQTQFVANNLNRTQYRPPDFNKPYFNKPEASIMQYRSEKKQVKQKSMIAGMFGGCFGCFGPMKVKKKKPYFSIEPIMIDSSQLPYAPQGQQQYFSAQYYTKPLISNPK